MADVVETLNAMHKVAYPDGVPDLVPNMAKIQQDIKFQEAVKLGAYYEQPVRLAMPGGFTHAKGDGTAGAFSLNDSIGGTQSKAQVYAYQILLRDQMSYEDAGKAVKGKQSFINGTEFFYAGLKKSLRLRTEKMILYGNVGIGTVGTYTSGDPSITITTAEWAPQLWAGTEGSFIDVMSGTSSTVRGSVSITKVDIDNKKIWLSGTVTGATANDAIYFTGNYGKEMLGIHNIMTNTGTIFNIDAGTYSLWKPSNVALSSAALSFSAIKKAVSKAVGKGLDEDVTLYCNPGGWDDLSSDIAALRTLDKGDVKKVDLGSEEIVYHSQNGKIEIKAHPMVKEGYAYGLCTPYWNRVGVVDQVMGAPGFEGAPFFHLPTKAGVEARAYTNQSIFPEMPGTSFYISGIVNSTTP